MKLNTERLTKLLNDELSPDDRVFKIGGTYCSNSIMLPSYQVARGVTADDLDVFMCSYLPLPFGTTSYNIHLERSGVPKIVYETIPTISEEYPIVEDGPGLSNSAASNAAQIKGYDHG